MHKFSINRLDISLLAPAMFLVLISLSVFYSMDKIIFRQQLFLLILSLFFYIIFLNINYRFFVLYSNHIYLIILLILSLLLIMGIEARGAVRWIELFGIRFQFSEIVKPFFIMIFASFLSQTQDKSLMKFIKCLLLLVPIVILTVKQPDLGNAIIYFSVAFFMLFMYRFPVPYFLILILFLIIPIPFFFALLHEYQRLRILSFFNYSSDPFGSSYNAIQSLISIGSGGLTGKGLGQATQSVLRFLPERQTDFIFAAALESLGFIGSILIFLCFFFLLYKIYKISKVAKDEFCYLFICGFYFLLLIHTFFNIGMNIGILPIVGITLPFVSYGGSSLLSNFIILGILSSVNFDSKNRFSMEIK